MGAGTWVRGLVTLMALELAAPLACSSDSIERIGETMCETTAECGAGERCVGSSTAASCLSREDSPCSSSSDCPGGLACGADLQCRSTCASPDECPRGQTCAVTDVCAEPGEVDSSGVLVDAVPASGGRPGAGGRMSAGGRAGTGGAPGSGGRAGDGGNAAGGVALSGGGSGGTGRGGAGSGGTGSGGAPVDPATCDPAAATNACQACVEAKCCAEYFGCNDDLCAGDGTTRPGELSCFQDCMYEQITEQGNADSTTILMCAGQCAGQGSSVAPNTQDIIACILSGDSPGDGGTLGCSIECYGVDLSGS